MDLVPFILGLCLLAAVIAGCVYLILRGWAGWTDTTRQAVITQLYAVAKTIFLALSDGQITGPELRNIFVAVLSVIAAMRGTTLDTVEQEFPSIPKQEEEDEEEPEPEPEPELELLSVTLDENKAIRCNIMYEDEFGFPQVLEINQKTTIYAVVEAPADLPYKVTASNARGQSTTLFYSPADDQPHTLIRHPFVLKAPEPNGWSRNTDGTDAHYDITITAETDTWVEQISIPAVITQ